MPHSESHLVLCPGWVTSRRDGDRHFVSAKALAGLYGVPMEHCVVWDAAKPPAAGSTWRPAPADVLLYPSFEGEYTLPDAAKKILERKLSDNGGTQQPAASRNERPDL